MHDIKLANGHQVLAAVVNFDLEISETRRGAGVVIAWDRHNGEKDLFVTWNIYPDYYNHDSWIAEAGHYGLTWKEAMIDMLLRFERFKREPVMLSMYEGEPF